MKVLANKLAHPVAVYAANDQHGAHQDAIFLSTLNEQRINQYKPGIQRPDTVR